jgi:hypothetical protein
MGWAFCGQDEDGRDIGYGVLATCDEPGCTAGIDRGLAYVCGGMHGGGEDGCGQYFCGKHLKYGYDKGQLCAACSRRFEEDNPDEVRRQDREAALSMERVRARVAARAAEKGTRS